MKKHTKIYMEYFGFTIADFIPCEVCTRKAVDIHHIDSRGMGGDPLGEKDVIDNLQALCRECHDLYGDDPKHLNFLLVKHLKRMR